MVRERKRKRDVGGEQDSNVFKTSIKLIFYFLV